MPLCSGVGSPQVPASRLSSAGRVAPRTQAKRQPAVHPEPPACRDGAPIESGIVGLCLYMILIISILRESFRTHVSISPLVTGLIFIIIYCIGQNGELTTSTTFLFVVSLIAENKLNILHPELQDA